MFPLNWYAKINKQGGEGGVRISFKNEKSLLKKTSSYLYGHSSPRLHSPFTQNEQMCGLLRL